MSAKNKTAPTDIDREAASLFRAAPGVRARISQEWVRIGTREAEAVMMVRPFAIDTDDPATVGVMLAQVATARQKQSVSAVDRIHTLPGEDERRFQVIVHHNNTHTTATGPTLGATLVAAMKAVSK